MCEADHIIVRHEEGHASCNTFESAPTEENTASERMMGYGNGVIGDGNMTSDYFRVEFAMPPDGVETVANATIGCTESSCKYNQHYVCEAKAIAIGSDDDSVYHDTHCQTYKPVD